MESKIKKIIGIALLACVVLTGLVASPVSAQEGDVQELVAEPLIIYIGGHSDPVTQTSHYYDELDKLEFETAPVCRQT